MRFACLSLVLLLPACAATPDARVPADAGTLGEVAFLAGTFRGSAGDAEIEESWSEARAGSMLGTGRTTRGGKTAFFEFLSITDDGQGLVYTAWPRGGPPTAFRRTGGGGGEIVFENPSHDFPKRIVYRREADGGITTRVEGDEGGVPHVEEQRLHRVAPPASAR